MATWHSDTPEMDQQVSTAIQNIEDNFKELHDVVEAITDGTLGTTEPANFKVDTLLGTNMVIEEVSDTDFDTGTETIDSVAYATYRGAAWLYSLSDSGGTNRRMGLYICMWSSAGGTPVGSDAVTTSDIGDTSGVTFSVDISGSDLRLRATTTSDNWNIKATRFLAVA